jgi:regulatory protein
MIITGIERQKKNRSRFSVFVDGAYAFSVGEEVYGKFLLHQGQELSESDRASIHSAEQESTVKMAALRYRSYRPRSTHEMVEYLRKKGYEERSVLLAIAFLRENKLLNDEEFARMLCRDRMMLRPVGTVSMKHLLIKKGIDRPVIDAVLAEVYDEENEMQMALREAERKHKRIHALPDLVRKKKIYEHLIRKGYRPALSMNVANQMVNQ